MSAPNRPRAIAFTAMARSGYEDIQVYTLDTWGEAQWTAYRAVLDRAFRALADNPGLGRSRDDLRTGIRTYPVGQHGLLYRIRGDRVSVSRIIHSRMDARQALGKR